MRLTRRQLRKIIMEQVGDAVTDAAKQNVADAEDNLARTAAAEAATKKLSDEGGAASPDDVKDAAEAAVAALDADVDPKEISDDVFNTMEEEEAIAMHPDGDVVDVTSMAESTVRVKRSRLAQLIREELIREMHHHLKHDVPGETRAERERREAAYQSGARPAYKAPPGQTLEGDWSPDVQELQRYYQSPQFRELLVSNIYNLLKGGVQQKAKDVDSMGFASASAEFYQQMNSASNQALERLGRELPGDYVPHSGQSGKTPSRPQHRRASSFEEPTTNWFPLEERRRRKK